VTSLTERQAMMGLLSRAKPDRLAALLPELPPLTELRAPQIGTVMVQGRIGGTGAAFNMGEMTVTRCVVQVGSATGHAHVQGRDKDHARRAAVIDALFQAEPALVAPLVSTLRAEEQARRQARAAKAAATRVEFFTLVRGEDA
jgi:alpha-D-ribose 1-methylphosphonate 5-triphosphate synthase subunit PhnG